MELVPLVHTVDLNYDQVLQMKDSLSQRLHMTTSTLMIARQPNGTYTVNIEGCDKETLSLQSPQVKDRTTRNLARLGQQAFEQSNEQVVRDMCSNLVSIEEVSATIEVFGERMVSATLGAVHFAPELVSGCVLTYIDGLVQLTIRGLLLKPDLVDGVWRFGPPLRRSVNEQFQWDEDDSLILTQDECEYILAAEANKVPAVLLPQAPTAAELPRSAPGPPICHGQQRAPGSRGPSRRAAINTSPLREVPDSQ